MIYKLDFYTEYNQFYVEDKGHQIRSSATFWSDQAVKERLAIEPNILGVSTACYGPVKGELELLKSENTGYDEKKYDHIVEGGLEINTGIIQVLDCPTSTVELNLDVPPGTYRVRIYSMNLDSVDGDEGDDYYRIEIWPDKRMERKVLKQYISK